MPKNKKLNYEGRDLEAMSFANNYHQWIFESISRYLNRNIVEVGAGSGSFSLILSQYNYNKLFALEPSDQMFPLLKNSLKDINNAECLNSFLSDSVSRLKNSRIDTFLYINVLEHIKDDQGELHLVNKVLSKNGRVVIFVPAQPYLYSKFDEKIGHFRRYKKADLVKKLELADFKILHSSYFDILGILPWLIGFKLLKSTSMHPTSIKAYDNLVVPVEKRLEKKISPPTGKNLLIIAEKV